MLGIRRSGQLPPVQREPEPLLPGVESELLLRAGGAALERLEVLTDSLDIEREANRVRQEHQMFAEFQLRCALVLELIAAYGMGQTGLGDAVLALLRAASIR